MRIEYQNRIVGAIPAADKWLPGDMEQAANGGYSITQANGNFLSVQPDGSYQDRDAVGPWETFVSDSNLNVLRVTAGPTFAIYYRYAL